MNSSELTYEAMRNTFKKVAAKHCGDFSENTQTSTLSLKFSNYNDNIEFHYLWGNRDVGITSKQDMKFILASSDSLETRIEDLYKTWKTDGTL